MFSALLKKEMLQQIKTQKFMISAVISIVLMLLCIHVSGEQYLDRQAEYLRASGTQTRIVNQIRNMTEENMGEIDFGEWDSAVFRKPTPLSIFCRGKENDLGVIGRIDPLRVPFFAQSMSKMRSMNEFNLSEVLDDAFENIDFTMVIRILFSLIAVFLAFDLVSGEREDGTLKMIHSFHASRLSVITAKWLSGIIVLALTIFTGIIASLLYLQFGVGITLGPDHLLRLMFLFSVSIFYILMFYQSALLLSCWVRSSQMAIVGMFLVWSIMIFIAPSASVIVSKLITQIPPLDYIELEGRKVDSKYQTIKREASEKATDRRERRKELNRIYDEEKLAEWQVRLDYLNTLKSQRRNAVIFSAISPAPIYDFAAELITGTSLADYVAFMNHTRRVNEDYSEMTRSDRDGTASKSFEDRKSGFLEICSHISHASLNDNRLSMNRSLMLSLPYIIWLFIGNCFLYVALILYYDKKAALI